MSLSLSLQQCAESLDAELLGAQALCEQVKVTRVSTDTRTLQSGDVFVALVGPNHDAHSHCANAEQKGASALVVAHKVDTELPQLVVADTRIALGGLARAWVALHAVPLVAVTGSNGKTTVKEMLKSILAELGPVLATKGNLNNEIGVPLTLLGLRESHQYAVVEMGANHVGEIGYLSRLAAPAVALVNNVSSAHLEGFGSLPAIAKAKSEIFLGLDDDGYAVINADDAFANTMHSAASACRRVSFGRNSDADVTGSWHKGVFTIKLRDGEIQPNLSLLGEHNRQNALAAAAVASCLDIQPQTIQAGLEKVKPVAGRLQRKTTGAGATIIDDSYNANPASAKAAIQVLSEQNGERVFILGDMRELGAEAEQLHAAVGNMAREYGINRVYTIGPLAAHAAHAFGESGQSFSDKSVLLNALNELHQRSSVFLVKGSRGSHMEEVVEGLMQLRGNGANCEVPTL